MVEVKMEVVDDIIDDDVDNDQDTQEEKYDAISQILHSNKKPVRYTINVSKKPEEKNDKVDAEIEMRRAKWREFKRKSREKKLLMKELEMNLKKQEPVKMQIPVQLPIPSTSYTPVQYNDSVDNDISDDGEVEYDVTPNQSDELQKFNRYNALTLAERVAVINEYDKGKGIVALATMFGCSKTQISFIIKHRKEYEAEWERNSNPQRVRRAISPHVLTLGICLFEYIWRLRHYAVCLTDENLKTGGKAIAKMMGYDHFRPSKRWLERFKSAYRLNGSKLLSPEIMNDGMKRKPVVFTEIFKDIQNELKSNGVDILNLSNADLLALKNLRTRVLNQSLHIEPRRKFIKSAPKKATMNGNVHGGSSSGGGGGNVGVNHIRNLNYSSNSSPPLPRVIKSEEVDEDDVELIEVVPDTFGDLTSGFDASNYSGYASTSYQESDQDYDKMHQDKEKMQPLDDDDIKTYDEAINRLKMIEDFVLMREDLRAVGLISQLENHFREKLQKIKNKQ